jgi:hypothetical protein
MPLYRDSLNGFNIEFLNRTTGEALDISTYDLSLEISQGCVTETLTMGDGLAFDTDGEDGVLSVSISKSRVNKFCAGPIRTRMFDNAGSDPVLIAEDSDTIEGKSFNQ